MSHIKYEVSLLKGECVGARIRPLLQDLIAYTPEYYGWMVTVTHYHIGKVSFVPIIKETGIVAVGLAATPHVKSLIHDKKSHSVTQVKQLR